MEWVASADTKVLLDWVRSLAALAGAIAAVIGLGLSMWALIVNASVNVRNKRMDVIMHCINRYDEIYKFRSSIDADAGEDNRNVVAYFRRYWGLKSDQLDYWLAGYIDPETMTSWFVSVVDAFRGHPDFPQHAGTVSFERGWRLVKDSHEGVNVVLVHLVEDLLNRAVQIENRSDQYAMTHLILEAVEASEKKLIWQLSRPRTGRYKIGEVAKALSLRERKAIAASGQKMRSTLKRDWKDR